MRPNLLPVHNNQLESNADKERAYKELNMQKDKEENKREEEEEKEVCK